MSEKAVVVYSGGMDSFTLLHKVKEQGFEVFALSFDYGQRHVVELTVAANVCSDLGVNHKVVDISAINSLIGGSSLTSDIDVPEGHYEEESMKATGVPNHDVCRIANYEEIEIITPYLDQSKIEILADGFAMDLDYAKTWTCYNGREKSCGKCSACQERLEAFQKNGVVDPLEYET